MPAMPFDIPTYEIRRATSRPAMDGWLDSPAWRAARWVDPFIALQTDQPIDKLTQAALLWDDHHLYLGVKITEPLMAQVLADADSAEKVFADDTVELYLDVNQPGTKHLVVTVNAAGRAGAAVMIEEGPLGFAYHQVDPKSIQVHARLLSRGWLAEIAIPFGFQGLPTPAAGTLWHGNVVRNDKLAHCWSSWAPGDHRALPVFPSDERMYPSLRFSDLPAKGPAVTPRAPSWPSKPRFDIRGIMYDTSRGSIIYNRQYWLDKLPLLHDLGLNTIMLYFENHLRYPSHPEFAPPGAWTLEDLSALQKSAASFGIDVIPGQTSLGHCPGILSHPAYQHLAEEGSDYYQFCPSHPQTYPVLDDIFRQLAAASSSPYININADESCFLGLCPRCRKEFAGWSKGAIFRRHVLKMYEILSACGKRMMMWDDMFWRYPDAFEGLPRDIIMLCWRYDLTPRYPAVDVCRAEGFDVVVCPGMSLYENELWLADYGADRGAIGCIDTLWEKHSTPFGSLWPHLLTASWACHEKAPADLDAFLSSAAMRMFGPAAGRLGRSIAAEYFITRDVYGCSRKPSPSLVDVATRQVLEEARSVLTAAKPQGQAAQCLEEFIYAKTLHSLLAQAQHARQTGTLTPTLANQLRRSAADLKAEGLARWSHQSPVPSQQEAFLEVFSQIDTLLPS